MKKSKRLNFKVKIGLILLTFITLIYVAIKYIEYGNKKEYVEYIYSNSGIVSDIDSYLHLTYDIRGELPSRQEFENYLIYIDSAIFLDKKYNLKLNHESDEVNLYSFYKKDNNLERKINAVKYSDGDENILQGFSFLDYLLNGERDIILFDEKLEYGCSDKFDYKPIFVKNDDSLILKDENLNTKLNNLLASLNLASGVKDDISNSVVYLYNGSRLKKMCIKGNFVLTKDAENQLLDELKKKFDEFKYIKFSVSNNDLNLDKG